MNNAETAALVQRLREEEAIERLAETHTAKAAGDAPNYRVADLLREAADALTPRTQLRDGVVRPRPHGCHHRPSEGPMGATELGNDTTLTEPVTDFAHLQRIADMHRQMTLNMSESRDELKHENRTR